VSTFIRFKQKNGLGAVYVFEYRYDEPTDQYEWVFIQKLAPTVSLDGLGYLVSLVGEFLAAGAPFYDQNGGAVHVFRRPAGTDTFQQLATLVSPNPEVDGHFGYAVAVDKDGDIAVGAPSERSYRGSVYVFARVAGPDWDIVQTFQPDVSSNAYFGWSIAMDRNFLVIGAPNEGNSGSTFVYEEQTTNSWKLLEPIITPNDGDGFDDFGHSVDLDNNNLIVGSPYAATSKLGNAGRVYHYLLNPSTGAVLSSSIEAFASVYDTTGLYFGRSVSISGNFLLVGSPSSTGDGFGSAHLFYQDNEGQWQFSQIILEAPPADTFRNSYFAHSVVINPPHVLVGMPYFDEPLPDGKSVSNGGATYFFDLVEECA